MEIKTTNFLLKNPFDTKNSDSKLFFIHPALQEFKKLKTPTKVAYNIVKSISSVEGALQEYEKTKIAICESLCERDERDIPVAKSGRYVFSEDSEKELNIKVGELMNSEITLNIFPVNQSDINDVKDMSIECYETLMRHGFIIDDTELPEMQVLNGKASKK